jgi:hypothetical protein
MKAKLIKENDGYVLYTQGFFKASTNYSLIEQLNIEDGNIRYKLSKQNCDEIFRVVDVEKLAEERFGKSLHHANSRACFREGFNKAMELNKDKVFTLEDMRNAIEMAQRGSMQEQHNGYGRPTELRFVLDNLSTDEIIQSLQQPTEIEVEIEMEKVVDETKVIGVVKGVKGSGDKITTYKSVPKLDVDGCLTLKRI